MKRGERTYCDGCHEEVAPKDPSQLNYGKVHYHVRCYIKKRQQWETEDRVQQEAI